MKLTLHALRTNNKYGRLKNRVENQVLQKASRSFIELKIKLLDRALLLDTGCQHEIYIIRATDKSAVYYFYWEQQKIIIKQCFHVQNYLNELSALLILNDDGLCAYLLAHNDEEMFFLLTEVTPIKILNTKYFELFFSALGAAHRKICLISNELNLGVIQPSWIRNIRVYRKAEKIALALNCGFLCVGMLGDIKHEHLALDSKSRLVFLDLETTNYQILTFWEFIIMRHKISRRINKKFLALYCKALFQNTNSPQLERAVAKIITLLKKSVSQ